MKAQKALHLHVDEEKKKPQHIGHVYAGFEKYDGWYGYLDFGGDNHCRIMSRAGREIPSLQNLSDMFELRFDNLQCQYEGRLIFEILIKGVSEFSELNGILNRYTGDCEAREAYLIVHDYIPLNECNKPFYERYEEAAYIVDEFVDNNLSSRLQLAPKLFESADPLVWKEQVEKIWLNSGEGIILKRVDSGYSPDKRNADLLKIKEELTLDLLVVGMFEGEGKFTGTLGGLIVQDKSGMTHRVSGMSDIQRDEWWVHPNTIIGHVVEIKAMKKLPDGSLREPRFKDIRWDKSKREID